LTKTVPLEGVTTEDGKSFQFVYVLGLLDGIDTQDVLSPHLVTISAAGILKAFVLALQFAFPEPDFQGEAFCPERIYPTGKESYAVSMDMSTNIIYLMGEIIGC
jgi:hypothetical protein